LLLRRGADPIAVECKASERALDAAGLAAFRRRYPRGANWLVVPEGEGTWPTAVRGLDVTVVPLGEVEGALRAATNRPRRPTRAGR
jgi:hypothetical protein